MNDRALRFACSIAFAITLTQDRLYTANQNTKFLHGAAAAGLGLLSRDWMANTVDPLPVFSGLVRLMFSIALPQLSYAIFAVLAVTYAWTLTSVVRSAGLVARDRRELAIFLAGLVVTQAAFSRWPEGLAEQYMLGHYLQPCVFGVLLIAGVAQYLRSRTRAAIALAIAAAAVHPDYLPATIVCLLVFVGLPREGGRPTVRRVLGHALLAVALLAPLALHLRTVLAPTSPELWRQSLDVLVTVRIPHHTEVARWFDVDAALRLAVMAAGTWLARDRALRGVMLALLVLTAGSMALTATLGVEELAAITPWRASVLLMPLALAVIVARGTGWLAPRVVHRERRVIAACASVIVLAVLYGAGRQVSRLDDYAAAGSMPPIAWVREHASRGDVWLVPIRDSDFDRFRLETGQPILANWKTHPYKDVELLEWQRRVQAGDRFYESRSAGDACDRLAVLAREYSVGAVIYPVRHPVAGAACAGLTELGRAGDYVVARVEAR